MTDVAPRASREPRPRRRHRRYETTTVNVLQVAGEGVDDGLRDKAPEIKDRFGIDLVVTAVDIVSMHTRALASLRSRVASFDLIDVLGFWTAEMVGGGYFEPLRPYLDDPSRTPGDYDFDDFVSGALDYTGFYDLENQRFARGDLYLIPGTISSSALMYYRADLLEAAGLEPPRTWADYRAAAETLNDPGHGRFGTAIVGRVNPSLFLIEWYTRFITRGGELMKGSPVDGTYSPNLESDEAAAALDDILRVKAYSPPEVLEFGFEEAVAAMATGQVALQILWTTITGNVFNPRSSTVADRVAVAPVPGEGPFAGRAIRGGWGFGIPRNSKAKDAAWQVLCYVTSREFELHQASTYFTTPNRRSVFEDPDLLAAQPYLREALDALQRARILEIACIPETFELVDLASRRFHAALSGKESVEEALGRTSEDWIEVLKRGGHLY